MGEGRSVFRHRNPGLLRSLHPNLLKPYHQLRQAMFRMLKNLFVRFYRALRHDAEVIQSLIDRGPADDREALMGDLQTALDDLGEAMRGPRPRRTFTPAKRSR